MTHRKKAAAYALERRAIIASGVLLLCAAVLYTYLVMVSVSHVVQREEFSYQSETLAAEVSELEQKFLVRSHAVTEQYAKHIGFVSVSSRLFVERGTLTLGNAR